MADVQGNQEELWCAVAEHTNYAVSNLGRVKRIGKGYGGRPGLILKHLPQTAGYMTVGLDRKKPLVHRLVWKAFRGPIPKGFEINHKDLNKANCALSNLELMTKSQNQHHAAVNGDGIIGMGEVHWSARFTEDEVKVLLFKMMAQHTTPNALAKNERVTNATLGNMKRRKTWSHNVFWKHWGELTRELAERLEIADKVFPSKRAA